MRQTTDQATRLVVRIVDAVLWWTNRLGYAAALSVGLALVTAACSSGSEQNVAIATSDAVAPEPDVAGQCYGGAQPGGDHSVGLADVLARSLAPPHVWLRLDADARVDLLGSIEQHASIPVTASLTHITAVTATGADFQEDVRFPDPELERVQAELVVGNTVWLPTQPSVAGHPWTVGFPMAIRANGDVVSLDNCGYDLITRPLQDFAAGTPGTDLAAWLEDLVAGDIANVDEFRAYEAGLQPPPGPSWIEMPVDRRVVTPGDTPPEVLAELDLVLYEVHVPQAWRASSEVLCPKTLQGWAPCVAFDAPSDPTRPIRFSFYLTEGEEIELWLMDTSASFASARGPLAVLPPEAATPGATTVVTGLDTPLSREIIVEGKPAPAASAIDFFEVTVEAR